MGHDVAVVCSADAERARAWAQSQNIARGTDSLDEALSDVDAVYISSTNDKHAAQARAAIQAGRHVLCEKPIALTVADALAMVDEARQAGVVLGTNHHLRNAPVHRTLRRLLQAGEIGRLLAVRVAHAVQLPQRLRGWRIDGSAPGSGVVLDITVHDMDTVRFVTGLEPRTVTAIGAAQDSGNVVDAVMVAGRLDEDVLLQTHDAFTVEHAGTGFELHGTEGSLDRPRRHDPGPRRIDHAAPLRHQRGNRHPGPGRPLRRRTRRLRRCGPRRRRHRPRPAKTGCGPSSLPSPSPNP